MGEALPVRPASQIADHWWPRPGWRPGRLFDTWHIVFDELPTVQRLAGRCRTVLARLPYLDLVPGEWLHMTIQGVGWSDELSDRERAAVVQATAEELRGLGTLEVDFGPAMVKGEALVLPVTPAVRLAELRRKIRSAIAVGLGRQAPLALEQAHGFVPHVSVAYARCTADATPYAAALSAVAPATARATIRNVSLIRQERQLAPYWRYRWDELARLSLDLDSRGRPLGV